VLVRPPERYEVRDDRRLRDDAHEHGRRRRGAVAAAHSAAAAARRAAAQRRPPCGAQVRSACKHGSVCATDAAAGGRAHAGRAGAIAPSAFRRRRPRNVVVAAAEVGVAVTARRPR